MSLSMYVSGRRLVLAVYFLHYNTRTKSYDISGRYHGQAVVPWLNDLMLHLRQGHADRGSADREAATAAAQRRGLV
uniref:Transposase n=1 Tax=Macrostomum lignano TaxID=282301 RepID=A0A1I8F2W6_9PLAT